MNNNIQNIEKGLTDLRAAIKMSHPIEVDQDYALLVSIKALADCKPNPFWIKGTNGRMLYINPAYSREFGIRVNDYLGAKDCEQWDVNIAQGFHGNDESVVKKGRAMKFIEDVVLNNKTFRYKILKWPVYINGQLIGVAGESLGVCSERT